jgi:hypothetical protein
METTSSASSGEETKTRPATAAAAATTMAAGSDDAAVSRARACGNLDLGDGVRVTAAGPDSGKVAHALWVMCYDAGIEGARPTTSRHVFLLCDERFQPRQPRQELSLRKLGEVVGYTSGNTASVVRLEQAWRSSPGGPVHAQGSLFSKASVQSGAR